MQLEWAQFRSELALRRPELAPEPPELESAQFHSELALQRLELELVPVSLPEQQRE